jgi:hypothetical protein
LALALGMATLMGTVGTADAHRLPPGPGRCYRLTAEMHRMADKGLSARITPAMRIVQAVACRAAPPPASYPLPSID